MREVEVHYSGQVQGVGFRYHAARIAGRHAVAGFVRNLLDGRVLLLLQGEEGQVREVLRAIHGRMAACIEDVREEWREPARILNGFHLHF